MKHPTSQFRMTVLALTFVLLAALVGPLRWPGGPGGGAEALAQSQFAAGTMVEVIDPDLYLRSAPGYASTVLARMALGTRGVVLAGPTWADGAPWYKIQTTTYGTGWASGLYLRAVSAAPTSTPVTGSVFPVDSTVEVIDPGLYLRSSAGLGTTVLARMALGTRGTVLQGPIRVDGHPWYQISTATYGTGWASGTYLRLVSASGVTPTPTRTPQPPTPKPTQTPIPSGAFPIGSTVEVIDPNLYLRSAPSLSSAVYARMALGTRGTVLAGPRVADGHPWYQIRTTAYGTGWASGKFLRLVTTRGSLLTPPADGLSRVIYQGISGRPEIALTFDAGSDRGYARQILDVLKANGIKASFGITGEWAEANPELIERMVDEGHQILNHTWSHPSFTGVSASPALTGSTARAAELTSTADYIFQLTGYRVSPYWRPPYGDLDNSVRRDAYNAGYYLTIMWSIDSMGWNGATVSQIVDRCAYGAEGGDIILMHVGSDSNDYAAQRTMIDILEQEGFSFTTVSQLLS